jgi:hypothetical protein
MPSLTPKIQCGRASLTFNGVGGSVIGEVVYPQCFACNPVVTTGVEFVTAQVILPTPISVVATIYNVTNKGFQFVLNPASLVTNATYALNWIACGQQCCNKC